MKKRTAVWIDEEVYREFKNKIIGIYGHHYGLISTFLEQYMRQFISNTHTPPLQPTFPLEPTIQQILRAKPEPPELQKSRQSKSKSIEFLEKIDYLLNAEKFEFYPIFRIIRENYTRDKGTVRKYMQHALREFAIKKGLEESELQKESRAVNSKLKQELRIL